MKLSILKLAGIVILIVGLATIFHHSRSSAPAPEPEETEQDSDVPQKRHARARTAPSPKQEYVNPTDGSTLVWIPGGTFTMGSDSDDEDEQPAHRVTVRGFWLGKTEVTNAQFARFLKALKDAGIDETRYHPSYWDEEGYNDPQQPVVGIIWRYAQAYCKWAGLRLPTEAEWEYAAAAGARQLKYPTATGEISHDLANFQGTGGKDKWEGPSPVAQFPPNPFGLYDLAGNAWEHTSSEFRPYPFKNEGQPDSEKRVLRVMRGGCWQYPAEICRTTHRHRFADHLCYDFAGFRVAKDEEATSDEPSDAETTESEQPPPKKKKRARVVEE